MKNYLLPLFVSALAFPPLLSAQQVISGAGGPITVNLNSSGQKDGVGFTNQTAPNECTLQVSANNEINSKNQQLRRDVIL